MQQAAGAAEVGSQRAAGGSLAAIAARHMQFLAADPVVVAAHLAAGADADAVGVGEGAAEEAEAEWAARGYMVVVGRPL